MSFYMHQRSNGDLEWVIEERLIEPHGHHAAHRTIAKDGEKWIHPDYAEVCVRCIYCGEIAR